MHTRTKILYWPSVVLINQCRQCQTSTTNSNLKKLLAKMPLQRPHVAEAQKQRIRIKEKASRYIPGTVNLQILGSGAPGSPASVYLFTDQSRYLFNCGEGTQRLAHEHKTKLARLEQIFLTRTSWQRIGGLPGLSLTVQDSGVPNLTLHGPDGLGELFGAMRRFVILKDLKVDASICDAGRKYDDSVLSVTYVPIHKKYGTDDPESNPSSRPPTPFPDNTDYFEHEIQGGRSNGQEAPAAPFNIDNEKRTSETSVMSYICQLKARPGALSLEKCVDKGVPPGPLLGQLKNGNSIRLADGREVHAHEVRAPDDPGPVFCVLDIPSVDYLDGLQDQNPMYERFQATAENNDDRAVLVIHFSPQNIIEEPRYQQFMNRFSTTTVHLVLNETNKLSGYFAAHRIQCQLNQLNEHMFPQLNENSEDDTSQNSNKRLKLDETVEEQVKLANNTATDDALNRGQPALSMTCFHLRPNKGLDRSVETYVNAEEYLSESVVLPGFTDSLDELKKAYSKQYAAEVLGRSDDYPKIVFLGTGSCIPNKTRNVSSILVHTTPSSCILLDAGEGTEAQMTRFYGQEKVKEVFRNLKAVYISHLHADHHIGLIGVLQERRRILGADAEPVMLLAPVQITSWLYFYDRRIESIRNEYTLISNGDLLDDPLSDERTAAMGLQSIRTCLVRHCPHSFGITLEVNSAACQKLEPFKITYSGDTMPCDELVTLGMDSTVLIHEATMEDELAQQARIKMHSTVSQAIEQGQRMNARYTILTHFSQRYAKLPRIEMALAQNVGIAFDNMEVTETDLRHMHLLYPTLKSLFSEHCEEMEQKAIKRAFKEQRAQSRTASPTNVSVAVVR